MLCSSVNLNTVALQNTCVYLKVTFTLYNLDFWKSSQKFLRQGGMIYILHLSLQKEYFIM